MKKFVRRTLTNFFLALETAQEIKADYKQERKNRAGNYTY